MSKNNHSKVIGYYDPEEGDIYCPRHSRNFMLPIMENDKDYFGPCNICGDLIDSNDSKQHFDN